MRKAAFAGIFLLLTPFFVSAATCPNLTRNLSLGSRGADVTQLQTFLIEYGELAQGNNTGYFGRLTDAAVKKFQCREMQICSGSPAVNGYGSVGPRTRAAISATCKKVVVTPTPPLSPVPPPAPVSPPSPTPSPTPPPIMPPPAPSPTPTPLPPLSPQTATVHYPQMWFDAKNSKDAQGYLIGYAYAPAIIREGSTYSLFSCTNAPDKTTGTWDVIRHTESPDGVRWSPTTVVLTGANVGSNPYTDRSTCDPSVVRFDTGDGQGPYYYMYYTGNGINIGGAVYVARSKTIRGPYLKYTQRGTWESNPLDPKYVVGPAHLLTEEIIANPVARPGYGAGEQTVVVKDELMYMWYSDDTTAFPSYVGFRTFLTTSRDAVHWSTPVQTDLGMSYTIESVDVKYDPLSDTFLLFDTPNKAGSEVYLERYRSTDGMHWSRIDNVCTTLDCFPAYTNNVGISGDSKGHLLSESTLVGFGSPYLNNPEHCDGSVNCFLESLNGLRIEGYAGATSLILAPKTRPLYQFVMKTAPFNGKYFFLAHVFKEGIDAGYSFLGQAFNVYTNAGAGLIPVYRCHNNGDHFMSRDLLCEGHTNEGLEGYLRETAAAGHAPVYRMYSAEMGDHLITLDTAQGASKGYVSEGIIGYAPLN